MTIPVQTVPIIGQPVTTEDSKVLNCLTELQQILGGNVDPTNIPNAAVTAAKFAPFSGWQSVALGTVGGNLYYYKSAIGIVYIRHDIYSYNGGAVSAATLFATLPIGYRPAVETGGGFMPYGTGGSSWQVPIAIGTNGEIRPKFSITVPAPPSTTLAYFDLQFRVES